MDFSEKKNEPVFIRKRECTCIYEREKELYVVRKKECACIF